MLMSWPAGSQPDYQKEAKTAFEQTVESLGIFSSTPYPLTCPTEVRVEVGVRVSAGSMRTPVAVERLTSCLVGKVIGIVLFYC